MKTVYALSYEYSYANNKKGNQSPEEAGAILGLYEDEDDADIALAKEKESGDWGDYSDEEAVEENFGWSDQGYILSVRAQDVIPSSKGTP